MTVTILQGDCRQVLAGLPPRSVDLVLADLPYGETSLEWDRWPTGWLDAVRHVMAPHASLWVFGTLRMFVERADEFRIAGFKLAQDVIWEKHNGTGLFNDRFRKVHEQAAQFYPTDIPWSEIYKKPLFTNDAKARTVRRKGRPAQWIGATGDTVYRSEDGGPKLMRSVMYARSEHGRAQHPTQKPISCLLPIVEYSCRPGGLVLDPMAGSGTTALACKLLDRNCTLIEERPEYIAIAERRLSDDAPLFSGAGA